MPPVHRNLPGGSRRLLLYMPDSEARLGRAAPLQPNLVLPGNVEVIFVKKPVALAQLQFAKRHGRGTGNRLPRAVPCRVNDEFVKVDVFPSHRDLKDAMKLAQRHRRGYLNPTPHHRVHVL